MSAAAVPKSGEVYYADDGTVSIVLDDNWDPNYEPPQKEIDEYAKWLGIDVATEKELLWIARDGLKAPLPKEWKPCKTDTGDVYYFNFKSGESIWDHPMDDIYKKKVEDERAKLSKTGREKPKPLVKGGAGSTDTLKPMSRAAIEEVRPKSGRLGAIGTVDEQKTIRPDISALLPTRSEQITATLLGKAKKEPLKDMKETERNFRKKYDSEFEAQRKMLSEKFDRQLVELKQQFASDLRKLTSELKGDTEDEIDQTRRNLERRNKRELQLYEESLEKQKEDLRRTLQLTQERLSSEAAGANRRVDNELSEKRSAVERQMTQDISRKRQELQEAWQREKTQIEMETQSKTRDLRTAHELRLERIRQQESTSLSEKLRRFEDELVAEVSSVKEQLRNERSAHSQRLREETSKAEAGAVSEYNLANSQFQAAVADAQREADTAMNRERALLQQTADGIKEEFRLKRQSAERDVAQQAANSADNLSTRRQAAERRVMDAEAEWKRRRESEQQAFDNETNRLVAESRSGKESAAKLAAASQAEALQREEFRLSEQRRCALEAAESAHKHRLSTIQSDTSTQGVSTNPTQTAEYLQKLSHMKQMWLQSHPAPIYHLPSLPTVPIFDPSSLVTAPVIVTKEVEAPPTSAQIAAIVEEAVADAMRGAERENASKIENLRQSVSAAQSAEFDEHRKKARKSMEDRLLTFRAGGGSPMRRSSKVQTSLAALVTGATLTSLPTMNVVSFGEAESQLTELRGSLQRDLNALAERLSFEAGEKLSAVTSAQCELDMLNAQLQAERAPPRPESSMGIMTDVIQRANTADVFHVRSTTPVLHASTPSHQTTPASGRQRTSSFEERLAKAHELLHRKKKEIRQRQKQLEDVREDWKRDMTAAKAARDEKQIATLKHVAEALEADARQLNKEALALKESYECLRREGDAYAQQQHHLNRGARSHPNPAASADLGALLTEILRRTDAVEQQVARVESQHASPVRGEARGDHTVSKWSSWLRHQPTTDGLGNGDTGARASPRKAVSVAKWVHEQQMMS